MTAAEIEAWIVVAQWLDSAPTYYGPFSTAEAAEAAARTSDLNDNDACVQWDVSLLQQPPAFAHVMQGVSFE